MFKIYDGRSEFYQWDLDRKVIVEDKSINQVHFCNRTDDCSLVTEVYDLDGLRVADVPNILLQNDWRINVYAYDHKYTKHSEVFEVVRRSKPADYIYTETELKTLDALVERMDNIESTIGEAVEDYLEANPPEVELKDYYTKGEVDTAIKEAVDNIETDVPDVDLTGYATEKYVDDKIADIDIPETDLSDYYNKGATDTAIKAAVDAIVHPKTDLSNYYTREETNNQINNKIAEIPKTDLSGYYTKGETNTAIKNAVDAIEHPTTDLSNYYNKQETDKQIKDKVDAIPETDLSNYYTKGQTETLVAEAIGQIEFPEGGGGDVQSVEEVHVGEYAPINPNIKLWIKPNEDVAFLTKEDADSLYMTEESTNTLIDNAIENLDIPEADVDLSDYYTKGQTETLVAESIAGIQHPTPDLSGYYTKTEIDGLLANLPVGDVPSGEGVKF